METTFSINAHKWTQKSIDAANEKKYLQAWLNTVPARANYGADVIANICMIPFSLIKIFFGSIEALYTWGHETKNLTHAINELYDYTNNSVSSFVGIISTTGAKSIRKENNLKHMFSITLSVSMFCLVLFSILSADKFKLNYNWDSGYWEPSIYWDLSRKVF